MGASSVGILSASVVSGDRSGSGVVSGHRSGPLFWRLGRLGVGQLGLGAKLVRRQHLYRPFFYIDHSFLHRYGFRGVEGGPLGSTVWVHNPEHRLGVPYANREVAGRFAQGPAFTGRPQGFRPGEMTPQQRFGNPRFEERPGGRKLECVRGLSPRREGEDTERPRFLEHGGPDRWRVPRRGAGGRNWRRAARRREAITR